MRRSRAAITLGVVCSFLLLFAAGPLEAGPLKKMKDRAKRVAERAVEDKVADEVDEAVRCAIGDKQCVEKAKKDGKEVVIVDADGNVVTDEAGNPVTDPDAVSPAAGGPAGAAAGPAGERPGEGVWRNYDFTPARDVWRHIVLDDEQIGRFPARQLEFVSGNMQIVEKDGRRVIESSSDSVFRVVLDRQLGEAFTLEFDLEVGAPHIATHVFFGPRDQPISRYEHYYLHLARRAGVNLQGQPVSSIDGLQGLVDGLTPVKLQVDGQYTILYVGTERAANIPNAKFPRTNVIEFHVNGNSNHRSYIGNITVAVGLDRLYESLMQTGSFTTRGIYFDVGSARIRPESTPTLRELEDTLKRHADLKIRIEGHTDSTGSDEANQQLSEQRAKAVVDYLVGKGIDGGRLQHVGHGESRPVADNADPAGRQQNRRVVIALQDAEG